MSPWIKDGDVIRIVPLPGSRPALGDVIAFVNPASAHLTVHRVVARRSTEYLIQDDNLPTSRPSAECLVQGDNLPIPRRSTECLIQGDNLPTPDGWIPATALLGRVVSIERRGRRINLGLGPERGLLATLSRLGLLRPLIRILAFYLSPVSPPASGLPAQNVAPHSFEMKHHKSLRSTL